MRVPEKLELFETPIPVTEQSAETVDPRHAHVAEHFGTYVRTAQNAIWRTSKGLSPEEIADLQQIALEKALSSIPYEKPSDKPEAWMNITARHATLDYVRGYTQKRVDLTDDGQPPEISFVASAEEIVLGYDENILTFIAKALDRHFKPKKRKDGTVDPSIAQDCYKLLLMRAADISTEECAVVLGINYKTVRTRMYRLRKALAPHRELLQAYMASEDVSLDIS